MDKDQVVASLGGNNRQAFTENTSSSATDSQRQATQAIIRGELEQIFDQNSSDTESKAIPVAEIIAQTEVNAQKPRSNVSPDNSTPQTNSIPSTYQQSYHVEDTSKLNQNVDWEKYHAAWQNYYQKYYEYYFKQNAASTQVKMSEYASAVQAKFAAELADRDQQLSQLNAKLQTTANFNPQDAALNDLKAKLRSKMLASAKKVRRSNHFWPIVATLSVLTIFLFLQYNQLIAGNVMAYVRPGNINPRTIVVNPTQSIDVGNEPLLIIPKINVEVPVAYDIANDHNSTFDAMRNGVAHFAIPGANAHPGEIGNTIITGHSSNDVFDQGSYKFIFSQLDKLNKGDIIYANYQGKRYTYSVTHSEVVWPNEVNKVVVDTDKPLLTLVTCVPLGTARQRLLVFAEQIAPDPSQAAIAPNTSSNDHQEKALPGQTKTLLQRLLGL